MTAAPKLTTLLGTVVVVDEENPASMRPEYQFFLAIVSAGLGMPSEIKADGQVHRFALNGGPGDESGWYVFDATGVPAGMFGDSQAGESWTWRADTHAWGSAHLLVGPAVEGTQ
jgi:phage/plasmid primase-like uncharacterized protein